MEIAQYIFDAYSASFTTHPARLNGNFRQAIGLPKIEDEALYLALHESAKRGDLLSLLELKQRDLSMYLEALRSPITPKATLCMTKSETEDSGSSLGPSSAASLWTEEQWAEILPGAAASGNRDLVLTAVDKFPGLIDHPSHDLDTILLLAAKSGASKLCLDLADRGADPALQGKHGYVPLHWLGNLDHAEEGFQQLSRLLCPDKKEKFLLGIWAGPSEGDSAWRGTPLHMAISRGSRPAVRALMGFGASMTDKTPLPGGDGDSILSVAPLFRAAQLLQFGMIEDYIHVLGDRVAGCSCGDPDGNFGPNKMDSYLTEVFDPGMSETSPNHRAARMRLHGSEYIKSICRTTLALHRLGLSLTSITHPLHRLTKSNIFTLASEFRLPQLITYLIKNMEVDFRCLRPVDENPKASMLACVPVERAIYRGDLEMFRALAEHPAYRKMFIRAKHSRIPFLHLCASGNHRNLTLAKEVRKKEQFGIEIDFEDCMGRTALSVAIENAFDDMADWLISEGANINAACQGQTLLCRFIYLPFFSESRLAYIIEQEAPNPKPDFQCWKSLHRNVFHALAASNPQNWDPARVRSIFNLVADNLAPGSGGDGGGDGQLRAALDQVDDAGCTPLILAIFHRHHALVEELLQRGAGPNVMGVTYPLAVAQTCVKMAEREADRARSVSTRQSQLARRFAGQRQGIVEILERYNAIIERDLIFGQPKTSGRKFLRKLFANLEDNVSFPVSPRLSVCWSWILPPPFSYTTDSTCKSAFSSVEGTPNP